MKENIRIHINNLFEGTPKTKRVYDLKEELIANLNEKFEDLVSDGKSKQEAYESVISGIGDVNEILANLKQDNPMDDVINEKRRKKNALAVTIAIALYVISLIPIIITEELELPEFIGIISFLILAGGATCVLIYHYMSNPKYIKADTTIVEEFKEWKSEKSKKDDVKDMVQAIVWSLIVGLYFIVSFVFSAWAYSWSIFLIGAAVSNIVNLCFRLKD